LAIEGAAFAKREGRGALTTWRVRIARLGLAATNDREAVKDATVGFTLVGPAKRGLPPAGRANAWPFVKTTAVAAFPCEKLAVPAKPAVLLTVAPPWTLELRGTNVFVTYTFWMFVTLVTLKTLFRLTVRLFQG
jgi:hypothetical protein